MNLISLQWAFTEQKETHSYHREDNTDGTEDSIGWGDAREIFREAQAFYGRIQKREDIATTFRLFGVWVHGFKVRVREKERCGGRAVRKTMDPD